MHIQQINTKFSKDSVKVQNTNERKAIANETNETKTKITNLQMAIVEIIIACLILNSFTKHF